VNQAQTRKKQELKIITNENVDNKDQKITLNDPKSGQKFKMTLMEHSAIPRSATMKEDQKKG